jgi:glycerol-3-phosphate dehydrogenase
MADSNLLDKVDVLIIGGGIAGTSVLRELSKYKLGIALVDKHEDVAMEMTGKCDGMLLEAVHEVAARPDYAGMMIYRPVMDRCLLISAYRRERLLKNLGVPFNSNGKLLVAFNQEELKMLNKCYRMLEWMAIPDVEFIINPERIRDLEPNISPKVIAALLVPTWSIDPWDLAYALLENATENGAKVYFKTEVNDIKWNGKEFIIETGRGVIEARFIVNVGGYGAPKLARMIGDDSFDMKATREEFVILDDTTKGLVRHIVRGYGANGTVQHLIIPTVDGNCFLGRGYEPSKDFYDSVTTKEWIEVLTHECKRLIPTLPIESAIRTYGASVPGVLTKTKNGYRPYPDYYIRPAINSPRFINVALGAAGMGASFGYSLFILELLASADLKLTIQNEKEEFAYCRKPMIRFANLSDEEKTKLIAENPLYGHIVCRCKHVSEAEVMEAIRRGAVTYDGVKYRTRAGMGRCQGGFDKPRILRILSKELKIPLTEVTLKGDKSVECKFESKELLLRRSN